ncbi:hypothetical protein BH11PLA2_BH11PLA2_34320 [soil metagenome]
MGIIHHFLARVEEASVLLDWFRSLPEKSVESPHEEGVLFYFPSSGPLEKDAKQSPLVSVFLPVRKRGVLTTVGEVHFLATPITAFSGLNKINKQFRKWLSQFPCVYSQSPPFVHEWDYHFEGSVMNTSTKIFALPGGMRALQEGAFFVSSNDNEWQLNLVCRTLQLRGVEGIETST